MKSRDNSYDGTRADYVHNAGTVHLDNAPGGPEDECQECLRAVAADNSQV